METNMVEMLLAKDNHVIMVGWEESYPDVGPDPKAWNPWTT